MGYRTAGFITDAWLQDIRDAIENAAISALADVVNISQGIANDAASEFGVGYDAARFDEIETSIGTAVASGRNGLGTTIVKSAGNSRADNYDVNADDWTNDTRQVVVAAVNQDGFVSSYSSYGAAVLVSGFGTPGEVVTTDRTGADGYNSTDFTYGFNGTSAAAPMVSGIVALMYEANPDLGWRDVQTILANSARHVGSDVGGGIAGSERYAWQWNASQTWNGGGQHYSNDYGYGLVDGLAAVRLAESWLLTGTSAATTSNEFTNTMDMLNAATAIPDGNATGLTFTGTAAFDDFVERVTVRVTFSTTFTADMEIYLTSPDGTVSELIDDTGASTDYDGTWTFETQAFRGERAAGQWSVRIVDDAGGDVLTVSDIVVTTYGAFASSDRYIFTNEYSDYAGVAGHSTALSDANGGTGDTINAAAVTSGSTIRLNGGTSIIDGVVLTIDSTIEHAIGGDGGDRLVGNAGSNLLYGMRGDDTLNGGDGADQAFGGTGDDTYYVNNVADDAGEDSGEGYDSVYASVTYTLDAGTWVDVLRTIEGSALTAIDLTGNELANQVIGNHGANYLRGLDGNDTLNGSLGDDTVQGGIGDDLMHGNADEDSLIGNEGNDTLDGGAGIDTMSGGGGDDTYYVNVSGDVVTEPGGASDVGGIDTVYSAVSRTLGVNQEHLRLQGTAATGNGNELKNSIQGTDGDNKLQGFAGNDTLEGGDGKDELYGDEGNDSMTGGGGNDSHFVDSSGDATIEAFDGGIDTVFSTVSRTLSANIEILRLQGSDGLTGNGNELNNKIYGNTGNNKLQGFDGNDTLDGKDGDDTLIGGEGNDTMTGRGGADTFRFANTLAGNDTITDFNTSEDQFDLGGGAFTQAIVNNGVTVLHHAGGTIRIENITNLTLAEWNGLLPVSEASATEASAGDSRAFDGWEGPLAAYLQYDTMLQGHGDYLIP